VVDHQGRKNPDDVQAAVPSQKVVIDTLKPQLRVVSAERKGEFVEVRWEGQEEHPDLASFKLEYRTADAPAAAWNSAPVEQAALSGQTRFRINNPAAVSVRLQMQDLAHNLTITPPTEVLAASGVTTAGLSQASTGGNWVVPTGNSGSAAAKTTQDSNPKSLADLPFSAGHPAGPDKGPADPNTKQVAATTDHGEVAPAGTGTTAAPVRRGKLPALQVVKSKQVTIEYALDKVGPSGVGMVELWLTQDDGQTWRRYAEDPDVHAPTPNGRYQRMVELPGEGVFGISLVVRSRAGLGKAPPRRGDLPQMRIEVDTTPPTAQLFVPAPEPNHRDALVLSWEARDPNHTSLAAKPITLQWAERKGEWKNIALNLPNTGRYVWHLPSNLPDRVYLRLIARDTAGNEGVAETAEPQLVDLSEPEGTIVGIVHAEGQ
jgi:hypothetical protein